MLHYKCLHITKWWNSADRRYRENCSCARVLVFVLIRIMCCWVWVELGFSPNSQPTNTIISADFRARPCSAQCVLIFFVFFNQEGDFSFFFSLLPLPRYHDTTCGDKNVGLLLLLSGTGFFSGCVGEFVFFRPNLFKFKPNWRHSFECRGKLSALLCWGTHSKAA